MNVVRTENTLRSIRGRGGGRGRNRSETIVTNDPITNALPKYNFTSARQPLVNNVSSTTAASVVTPKNSRRYPTTSSSSLPKSSFRRHGQTCGGRISPRGVSSNPDECVVLGNSNTEIAYQETLPDVPYFALTFSLNLAITSGRGFARGEVGMAAIDVQSPHLILCQISDSDTYINTLTKIYALNPVEIVMPDTMCERSVYGNGLYRAIKEKFDTIEITSIPRIHFHDSSGMERIRTHCAQEFSSVEIFVKQKYYALAAAAALFKYVEYIQKVVYTPKSMRIDFQGSQNTTMIDIESALSLELVSSRGSADKFSLLGSLDRCSTPMGRRLLRTSILQPPCDSELIKSRQACVTEFVSNRAFESSVQPIVKRLYGASRLLNLAVLSPQLDTVQAAEKNLNYALLLKNTIDIIPELGAIVSTGRAPFFQKVTEDLKDPRYDRIKEKILSVVQPEARAVSGYASSNLQRCFAIRFGINDMLDVARRTYCELIDDMQSLVDDLSKRYNLRLSLGCNAHLGYHVTMDVPRSSSRAFPTDKLPQDFIEVHKRGNTLYMTTEYLLVLSQHCRDASEELHVMSNVLLNETLSRVREYIGCLLKLSDDVAELDLLASMARISSVSRYVLPTFGKRLRLEEARHPIMDISGTERPIPNDVRASVEYNFHTITGPNMSGKSVYLKQIVLLQIMAQMGCYVPAERAEFRLADRIFCKMFTRADIESNASTFVREINETRYILQSLTATSLVILDELCRGTTVEEGTSLVWSISEKFIRTTAFTFSATHFFSLTRLAEIYHGVSNHYIEADTHFSDQDSHGARLIYAHRLKPGVAFVWNYGIALARSTGLPESIVVNAQRYADEIAKSVKPLEIENPTNAWKKIFYDCVAELRKLVAYDRFTASNVVELVNSFKIRGIFERIKSYRTMETTRVEDEHSRLLVPDRTDSRSRENKGGRLCKRRSETSFASRVGDEKSRILSDGNSPIVSPARFNYSRRIAPTTNSSSASFRPSRSESFADENDATSDRENSSMVVDEAARERSPNRAARVRTGSGDSDVGANSHSSLTSTLTNRPSARNYRASLTRSDASRASSVLTDTFGAVEGRAFDRASFLRSLESTEKAIIDD